jgi:sec-independent protein translocase protein TatA
MFGRWPEILALLFIALLVFGPKRMIEMGSSLGKTFRELRDATKDLNWSSLTSTHETPPSRPASPQANPFASPSSSAASSANSSAQPAGPTIVDSTIEHVEEPSREE